MPTRKRAMSFSWPGASWKGAERRWPDDGQPGSQISGSHPAYVQPSLQGEQVTVSEDHPEWKSRKAGSSGDIGGPFLSSKRSCHLMGGTPTLQGNGRIGTSFTQRSIVYKGLCRPDTTFEWPPYAHSSDAELSTWGTHAISECKPTNIFLDLSASLAELAKDGIPKLGTGTWKTVAGTLRNVAHGHLAVEFGWKPVVDDVYKTFIARENADTLIKQYLRDSGKTVRRKYGPHVQLEESFKKVSPWPPWRWYSEDHTDKLFEPWGETIRTHKVSKKRWFSGAFTYHLPYSTNMEVMSPEAVKARGLVNLELTPETLWELAPWSWAVDWVLPVDDLIGNLQDQSTDGLVLRYGYVMEHSISSYIYTYIGRNSQYCGVVTLTAEVKKRIQASPFGFGIDWNGLSPRQVAIATSLGITRR